LTLRAVAGLTTREIAAAFLVPEATMAQRISRAKAKIGSALPPAALQVPTGAELGPRLRSVLHVLYLLFNEGYATSGGPDLARTDLSGEAIRLARAVHASRPDDPEVAGLLALMLLNDARRPARTGPGGELIPLAEQDRGRWDRGLIAEGVALITSALNHGPGRLGEYQVQAAIAAGNPMVSLNRAVAVAMADGPAAGLASLNGLADRLGDHHRLHSVRAHLLELAGDTAAARTEFAAAAARTANRRERDYLTTKAAQLGHPGP